MLEIVIQDVLLPIRRSYLAIYSLLLTNVKWHSCPRPVTVNFQPIRLFTNYMTLIPSLTFTKIRMVSVEHLQRMWHANTKRLPFWTPESVHFWDLLMLQSLRPIFPSLPCLFSTFRLEYPSVLSRFRLWIPILRHSLMAPIFNFHYCKNRIIMWREIFFYISLFL